MKVYDGIKILDLCDPERGALVGGVGFRGFSGPRSVGPLSSDDVPFFQTAPR
jgi:hypothetical protein